jgi:hypothetical protein
MNFPIFGKALLIMSGLVFSFGLSMAQRKSTDPRHENHYRTSTIETNDVRIEFEDSHSQQTFTVVKMKITNKTSDYIMIKPSEIIFKYEFGEYHPSVSFVSGLFSKETILLGPVDSGSRALKVTGSDNFHVEKLSILFKGFYKLSLPGEVVNAPDFSLPPSTSDFSAGAFECSLDKIKKETKETDVTFTCIYKGSGAGVLHPDAIAVKLENGSQYANDTRNGKTILLLEGNKGKLSASFHVAARVTDMQFANMSLLWKNTFSELKIIPIQIHNADFSLDPGKTEGKNR